MNIRTTLGAISLATVLALSTTGCGGGSSSDTTTQTAEITTAQKTAVLTSYADIALANYTDSLNDAKALVTALKAFTDAPTDATLTAAKEAWLTSRESYGQTEIFRLSDGPIDAEEGFAASWDAPEGQLNAWPLDENMIDYTTDENGDTTSGNIIDTAGEFTPTGDGATKVDATTINKETLAALNENGGEANVATGYHAIEFLLWGQDQDYANFTADSVTQGALVAGERPLEDYTTNANADRRKAFLNAAAELIVDDLTKMVEAWTAGTGSYREAFLGSGSNAIAQDTALKNIMSGMGIFIKSELANERIAVAVLTPSEEDEHSCFSDNTHRDVDLDYIGFKNVLKGTYNGTAYGTSMYSLLSDAQKTSLDELITSIDTKVKTIDEQAKSVEHFDYQIKDDSANKSNIVAAKNELRDLGDEMITVAKEYGITLTSEDVTDSEETQI
ncbi:MAG TPA: imelysin [Campylobacterales bacterium]|nr:imelysin [Campylobacterales bacterium]